MVITCCSPWIITMLCIPWAVHSKCPDFKWHKTRPSFYKGFVIILTWKLFFFKKKPKFSLTFKIICLFERLIEREIETERSSISWLILQIFAMAKAGPGQSQKLGVTPGFSPWVQGSGPWAIFRRFPRHIFWELDQQWSSQISNLCTHAIPPSQVVALPAVKQH